MSGRLSRGLGLGSGAAIAGWVAHRLDPGLLASAARELRNGCVVVTGTNGKTTTAAMLVRIVGSDGTAIATNATGANLRGGVVSALLDGAPAQLGVLEVDEAAAARIAGHLRPRVMVWTNAFRDQLDRYGEVDRVLDYLSAAARGLSPEGVLVANGDDPGLVAAAESSGRPVAYFGLREGRPGTVAVAADSMDCRRCGRPLVYRSVHMGHLGDFRCPACGWGRPELSVTARLLDVRGLAGLRAEVETEEGVAQVRLGMAGVHAAYNLAAAFAASRALGVPLDAAARALDGMGPAFGRGEDISWNGRRGVLLLMKNPAGGNELVTELAEENVSDLLLAVSDRPADGTDVSWLWDVEFERLAPHIERAVASGTRATDAAVRLKYAGIPVMETDPDARRGLEAIARAGEGRFAVLATYTSMLDIRTAMHGRRRRVVS